MSETKHSPEPWHYVGDSGAIEDDEGVTCAEGWGPGDLEDLNARRIVAAVNACAGISTEALESGALGEALNVLHEASSYADIIEPMLAKTCPGHAEALRRRLSDAANALRRLGRLP